MGDGGSLVTTTLVVTHTYTTNGIYTVSLAIEGPDGSDALTRTNYITVADSFPSSLEFDGTDDLAQTVDLPLWTTFTVEAWVKRLADSGGYETFLSDANSGYSQAMLTLFIDGGNGECAGNSDQFAYYQVNGDEAQCSGVTAELDSWYHIAVSRDSSGNRRFFVNGNLVSTDTGTTAPANSNGLFTFGQAGQTDNEFFAGRLDEVRLSDIARYTASFTPSTEPFVSDGTTVALWHLDEAEGQTFADSAGNDRDGVLGTDNTVEGFDPSWSPDTPILSPTGGFTTLTRVISYDYDDLYRLTSADYSTGEVYTYTYDAVGNRRSQINLAGTTVYTYDQANRLVNVNGTTYNWDANGNLLDDGSRAFAYDASNRLISVTTTAATTQFEYNGLGDRTAQTSDGQETRYTLDPSGLAQVLLEVTESQTNVYLSGLAQYQGDAWVYQLPDHLGSARQVVDGAGQVTLGQSYDPFGNISEQSGSGASGFGYTGEQEDAGTGLVFLRARYYDPTVGRFISQDPFQGHLLRPQTQNLFAYVTNNAPNRADPSGYQQPGVQVVYQTCQANAPSCASLIATVGVNVVAYLGPVVLLAVPLYLIATTPSVHPIPVVQATPAPSPVLVEQDPPVIHTPTPLDDVDEVGEALSAEELRELVNRPPAPEPVPAPRPTQTIDPGPPLPTTCPDDDNNKFYYTDRWGYDNSSDSEPGFQSLFNYLQGIDLTGASNLAKTLAGNWPYGNTYQLYAGFAYQGQRTKYYYSHGLATATNARGVPDIAVHWITGSADPVRIEAIETKFTLTRQDDKVASFVKDLQDPRITVESEFVTLTFPRFGGHKEKD